MNNVFLRDRMERNNSDFEGSGIGEGRFDEYEEEKAKFSDAILPFIILTFMIIGLAGIIYLHITEIRKISGATAVEIEYDGKQQFVTWKAPDGRTYSYNASYAPDKGNSVTLYYKGTDYRNGIIKTDVASWIKVLCSIFTVTSAGLIFGFIRFFIRKNMLYQNNAVPI